MGKSKASRAAEERLKNQFRCTNSGQFANKDDEGNETDQMCVVEELTEALLAARQNEQNALASVQDAVDAMQMMSETEQNEGELLLLDDQGNEISVSDHFNRETILRDVDPEEDDPEDGPEVFEIDVGEESGEEIFAAESLRFLKDANSQWQPRKITQRGESDRTERRKKHEAGLRQKSATAPGQKSITGYLTKLDDDYDTEDEMNDGGRVIDGKDDEEIVGDKFTMQQAIKHLSENEAKITRNAKDDKKDSLMMWQKVQATAVVRLLQRRVDGDGKMEASADIARALYGTSGAECYKARSIRYWAEEYLKTGELVTYKQGKHAKVYSIITDENIKQQFKIHLRGLTDLERTPQKFMFDLNERLLRDIPRAPAKVCVETATRWMRYLGFDAEKAQKGWFTDGHERADVVADREQFLKDMVPIEARMRLYDKDGEECGVWHGPQCTVCASDSEGTRWMKCDAGCREAVGVTHDESTMYANDGKKFFWMENGKKKLLPKSAGSSIMISGFMCACHGFMSGTVGDTFKRTYQVFKAGKNRQGWFTNKDLNNQFEGCADLIRQLHPDADIYTLFDNSMTHRAKAPDGLDASALNKSDGGANVSKQRDGWYWKEEAQEDDKPPNRVKVVQKMQTDSGVQKGLLTILKERGKEKGFGGHVLNKICLGCEKRSPRGDTESDFVRSDTCCMYYVLSQEPDFLEQKPWLHETVEKQAGFHFMLYPKYHCELNYIEMVWGYIKAYHRRHCTYSFKDLDGADGLVKTLNERIPISFVRRASNHCLRYMSFYRAGLHGPELEFAVRKYRSHRAINPEQKAMIKLSFEEYKLKKRTRK